MNQLLGNGKSNQQAPAEIFPNPAKACNVKSPGLLSSTRGHSHPTDVIEGFFPSRNQNSHRSYVEL